MSLWHHLSIYLLTTAAVLSRWSLGSILLEMSLGTPLWLSYKSPGPWWKSTPRKTTWKKKQPQKNDTKNGDRTLFGVIFRTLVKRELFFRRNKLRWKLMDDATLFRCRVASDQRTNAAGGLRFFFLTWAFGGIWRIRKKRTYSWKTEKKEGWNGLGLDCFLFLGCNLARTTFAAKTIEDRINIPRSSSQVSARNSKS